MGHPDMTQRGRRRARTHVKDPFYRQILEALEGIGPDSEVFEACMGDILRSDLPGLVPVPGGKDQGRDGEFPDRHGRPSPLICTTHEDVARNLCMSLDAFLRGGSTPGQAALATSRALTWAERRKLSDLAAQRGFTLRPVFERRAVADRLYRNSRWCKELLGLSGAPSALSVVPPTRRPLIDLEPIGRQADIDWVRSSLGDRVLSGAPGAGKTFLLYYLMREGWNALFLVGEDEQAIANAVREQQPEIVVVDDAHGDPSRLTRLIHLRKDKDIDAEFSILATSWEGGRKDVQESLGVSDRACRRLELLTRNQIVEVFHGVGVRVNDDAMRALVDQAANKPGLAATIGTLWLQGAWEEVLNGSAVAAHLVSTFGKLVGTEAEEVMAAFALGGDRGLTMKAVGDYLRLDLPRVRRLTNGLAAGGVLSEIVDNAGEALAVHPIRLRSALLRSVFFSGKPDRFHYQALLPQDSSRSSAVEALAIAKLFGADVPAEELRELVLRDGTPHAWEALARSNEDDARWVLENYSGDALEVLSGALTKAPAESIDRILKRAEDQSLSSHRRDAVMDLLVSWAKDIKIVASEAVQRRRRLAEAGKRYLLSGGNRELGVRALMVALAPDQKGGSVDPGRGDKYTITWGLLPPEYLCQLSAIWEAVRDVITIVDRDTWLRLSRALWDWIYPEYAARSSTVDPERKQEMHTFAAKALMDLVPLASGSPGLAAGLLDLGERLEIELPLVSDPVFDLLFAPTDASIRSAQVPGGDPSIFSLALVWAKQAPTRVAKRLEHYEREAATIGRRWNPNAVEVCRLLAAAVSSPDRWLKAFMRRSLRPGLSGAFLEATVAARWPGWSRQLERCLEDDALGWMAAGVTFQLPDPPAKLLEKALKVVGGAPSLVESMCLRKEMPLQTLKLLLQHPDWEVSLAVAVGEWASDPRGGVRAELRDGWTSAVIRASALEDTGDQYWLGMILAGDGDLAFNWLNAHLPELVMASDFPPESPGARAVGALSEGQRHRILGRLGACEDDSRFMLGSLVPLLIGRDAALYRELLREEKLVAYHDAPLSGLPDSEWEKLAVVALEAGLEPGRVAAASLRRASSYRMEDGWGPWGAVFARLEQGARADLRSVGLAGREIIERQHQLDRGAQRQRDVHGLP